MLKTKYLNKLVASLEEISEDLEGNEEELQQQVDDANVALEGYQELLLIHNRLKANGVKFDEQIVSSVLMLASSKINRDPLLSTYSQESVTDKAKDFGKWIVEKIKALYKWVIEKIQSFAAKVKELGNKVKTSKMVERVKNLVGSEKVSINEVEKNIIKDFDPSHLIKVLNNCNKVLEKYEDVKTAEEIEKLQSESTDSLINESLVKDNYSDLVTIKGFPIYIDNNGQGKFMSINLYFNHLKDKEVDLTDKEISLNDIKPGIDKILDFSQAFYKDYEKDLTTLKQAMRKLDSKKPESIQTDEDIDFKAGLDSLNRTFKTFINLYGNASLSMSSLVKTVDDLLPKEEQAA